MDRKSKLGFIAFSLFFIPFFSVGCIASWQIFKHLGEVQNLSRWIETPATVSHIKSHNKSEEPSISTIYKYEVNSETFEGRSAGALNKGGFSAFVFDNWEKEIKQKQQTGKIINCFYNPDNPNQAVLFRRIVWDYVFLWSCFALVFGMVGLGGLILVAWAYRIALYENKLKARFPLQPWKWKKNWETGRIRCNGKYAFLFLWPFAIIWNAICLPALIPAYKAFNGGEKFAALAILFPICGLFLIRWAIQKTLSYNRIGASSFHLKTFPGVIGGTLSGSFTTGKSVNLENDICFQLQCFETTPSRGKNDTQSKTLIWSDEVTIEGKNVGNLSYAEIPVEFSIPYSCRPSSEEHIDWTLTAKSKLAGSDLDTSFDIPIFKTENSDKNVTEMNPLEVKKGKVVANDDLIKQSQFRVEGPIGGTTSISIPSVLTRLPGVYISLLVFEAIFFVGLLAAIHFKIGYFPIFVISGFNLLLVAFLFIFSCSTRLEISKDKINATRSVLFYSKTKSHYLDERSSIGFKHSASGNTGDDYQSYYSVTLNKTSTLVQMIDSKQAARWLAKTIEEAAELEQQKVKSDSDSSELSYPKQPLEDTRPWVE